MDNEEATRDNSLFDGRGGGEDRRPEPRPDGSLVAIGDVRYRQYVRVEGRIRSVRVQPRVEVPTLECVLVDSTGALSVIFLGRRAIAGIEVGAHLRVEGMAGESHGRLAVLNPQYELVPNGLPAAPG